MKRIQPIDRKKDSKWLEYIERNRIITSNSPKELVVDFTKMTFLRPLHLVSTACLVEEYNSNGYEIRIKCDEAVNARLSRYLKRIKLYEYWKPEFKREHYTKTDTDTYFCLWKYKKEMMQSFLVKSQEYFEKYVVGGNKDFEPLNVILAELLNNISDHSNSLVDGYVASQFYPAIGQLEIAVCDFGDGIPIVINKYEKARGNKELSDKAALEKAFNHGYSTKSKKHNRGFGLDTIKSVTEESKGKITAWSKRGAFRWESGKGKTTFTQSFRFNGTIFDINLDTNTFFEKEEGELSEFFF